MCSANYIYSELSLFYGIDLLAKRFKITSSSEWKHVLAKSSCVLTYYILHIILPIKHVIIILFLHTKKLKLKKDLYEFPTSLLHTVCSLLGYILETDLWQPNKLLVQFVIASLYLKSVKVHVLSILYKTYGKMTILGFKLTHI